MHAKRKLENKMRNGKIREKYQGNQWKKDAISHTRAQIDNYTIIQVEMSMKKE